MLGKVIYLDRKEALEFLLPRHYSGRAPQISHAFGWIVDQKLQAVITYGKPVNNNLCNGICGADFSSQVYELNRLCREDNFDLPLSQFVSATLRRLSFHDMIIVSYADTGMNHNGYIYQACNFLYTGKTKERLEFHVPNGHSRHGSKDSPLRQIRTAKHRYVYFATRKKKVRDTWLQALRYETFPYPKEQNSNYVLGTVLQPKVVNIITGVDQ